VSVRAAARCLALTVALAGSHGCSDGCSSKEDAPAGEAKTGVGKPAPPAPATAVIEGVVRMAGGAELPSYPQQSMEKRVLQHTEQAPLPDACAPPKTTDRQPVQVTPDGLLTNIVIAASDFAKQPKRAPVMHEVVIEDCRLKPAVVVAMKGDTLRVRNTLDYPFMPTYGDAPVVKTLIRGQTYEAPLDKPGVSPLLCGFTAPCGRTDVVVLLHPLHTATDAEGKFKLENFPANEDVKLSAWHPLFEESAIQVRARPGEVERVELVLTPLGQGAPAPADAGTAKPAAPAPAAADAPKQAAPK
jgi:hypothetical protein